MIFLILSAFQLNGYFSPLNENSYYQLKFLIIIDDIEIIIIRLFIT
jgi:hypothetical protein